MRAGGGGGGQAGGRSGEGIKSPRALVWFQGCVSGPEGKGEVPAHTDKSSGKLEKTFPFFPLTFYDNSYFQMKGEKSQERNSQMSQKGEKKIL